MGRLGWIHRVVLLRRGTVAQRRCRPSGRARGPGRCCALARPTRQPGARAMIMMPRWRPAHTHYLPPVDPPRRQVTTWEDFMAALDRKHMALAPW